MCEMVCQIVQKKQEKKRIEEEQAAKAQNSKIPACSDDDDDYSTIAPNEPIDSLSIGDEHLNTIPVMESNEFMKSCVENLALNPHESEGENESLLNCDFSIFSSSSKIDSLLDEFAGELTLLKSIPSGIDDTDCHPKNEIHLTKRLLYDNSSPRPLEEFVSENSNADIESFSPSPIPVKDIDSFMEEIDLSFNPDDPMPSSIEEDDDDFKRNEKSPHLLSHQGFEILQPSAKYPMMIHGKNIPILDVSLFHFYPLDHLNLLHLAGSQPMLKSSYKAKDGVIISIPSLVGGVTDVVVEIKGTGVYYDYDNK
nr:hypothetical protein [Tanacetum cinerariifolium]